MILKRLFSLFLVLGFSAVLAQENGPIKLNPSIEYEVAGINVVGGGNLDESVIVLLSGLAVGDKLSVPSEKLQKAINTLWDQNIFSDVAIYVVNVQSNRIFLEIRLAALPKLSRFYFVGDLSKSRINDIREEIQISRGMVVSENLIVSSESKIRKLFIDKGNLNVKAKLIPEPDTTGNTVSLRIQVYTAPVIKIEDIGFRGTSRLTEKKLRKSM